MEKVVIAQMSLIPSQVSSFLKLSEKMIDETTKEKGNIFYKLLKEVNSVTEFFFYEKYENQEAVNQHNASEHFKNYIDSISPLLSKDPIITVY